MLEKNQIVEHKLGLESSLKSIGPFLNLTTFTGTIYLVSKNHYSVLRNFSENSSSDFNCDNISIKKYNTNVEASKFIEEKFNQYSCRGIIPLDIETHDFLYKNSKEENILFGVLIGQNLNGDFISHKLFLKESNLILR